MTIQVQKAQIKLNPNGKFEPYIILKKADDDNLFVNKDLFVLSCCSIPEHIKIKDVVDITEIEL